MEKLLEKLNYFVYDSQADYFDLTKDQAKAIVEKLEEKLDILKMYDLVFQDMVESYIDGMEEEDKIKIDSKDIKEIAYKMIYKNEYIWEIINDTINIYLEDYIMEEE